jgi:hypothetical protein
LKSIIKNYLKGNYPEDIEKFEKDKETRKRIEDLQKKN